jgi:hypothetical protein
VQKSADIALDSLPPEEREALAFHALEITRKAPPNGFRLIALTQFKFLAAKPPSSRQGLSKKAPQCKKSSAQLSGKEKQQSKASRVSFDFERRAPPRPSSPFSQGRGADDDYEDVGATNSPVSSPTDYGAAPIDLGESVDATDENIVVDKRVFYGKILIIV